jgi:hypothetical protein
VNILDKVMRVSWSSLKLLVKTLFWLVVISLLDDCVKLLHLILAVDDHTYQKLTGT